MASKGSVKLEVFRGGQAKSVRTGRKTSRRATRVAITHDGTYRSDGYGTNSKR